MLAKDMDVAKKEEKRRGFVFRCLNGPSEGGCVFENGTMRGGEDGEGVG